MRNHKTRITSKLISRVLFTVAIAHLIKPAESAALKLYLDFFIRPSDGQNLLFQTPQTYDGRFFFVQNGRLFVLEKKNGLRTFELKIDEDPLSEISKAKNFLFCSSKSRIVEIGSFGVESKRDIPFPCISPPVEHDGKIYTVDLKGNVCKISNDDIKCVRLREARPHEFKLLPMYSPRIQRYLSYLLVPYENELYALSEDLNIRYRVLAFESGNINHIKVDENSLLVSTRGGIYSFALERKNGAVVAKKTMEFRVDEITGTESDGDLVVFTYRDGFGFIKGGRATLKPIRGVLNISQPVLYRDHLIFIAQFGEIAGRIFGARKSSVIVVSLEGTKVPNIIGEYVIHSFARKPKVTDDGVLYFLTEDSTLYVFRARQYLPNL